MRVWRMIKEGSKQASTREVTRKEAGHSTKVIEKVEKIVALQEKTSGPSVERGRPLNEGYREG